MEVRFALKGDKLIKMSISLKNGQMLRYDEINKVDIVDDILTISTFKGQYTCVKVSEIASFEFKYPQEKSAKTFAIFKYLISTIRGDDNGVDQ